MNGHEYYHNLRFQCFLSEVHEGCLRRGFDRTSTETGIAAVLAEHLLSQLIPYPSNYFLDKTSKGKPDGCPCGCGKLIHFGITCVGKKIFVQLLSSPESRSPEPKAKLISLIHVHVEICTLCVIVGISINVIVVINLSYFHLLKHGLFDH